MRIVGLGHGLFAIAGAGLAVLKPHLPRLRANMATLTRLDSLAGNLGLRIRATRLGRQRRSLVLAHGLAERADDRHVPGGLGRDS